MFLALAIDLVAVRAPIREGHAKFKLLRALQLGKLAPVVVFQCLFDDEVA